MFISNSVEETIAAGREAGRAARAGDVLALVGDLGAGKTQFVKGVAAGIGTLAEVTSPTFTLIHEYSGGRLPIYHFDFHRLENSQAVLQLGFDDYRDGLSVIEWADKFPELIPSTAQWISFEMKNENARIIKTGL
ncbi:MAG: tRNA threonylcarbamoyladenosine biosynthesis protein TsaE [Verrucomicrobiota bacterium]|jgi:tRNA threonylcarbamoyladenosine biosynthesis protein TsaE